MQRIFREKWNAVAFAAVLVAFFIGLHVGASNVPEIDNVLLANKTTQVDTKEDFSPFWKVWNSINDKYPHADKITDKEKVYGAISGLVDSLNDPYSVFFRPDEAKSFNEEISGNFSGVGMEVGLRDKVLTVIAPIKDTPAYRAGILPGDKILKIEGKSTANMTIEDAVKLMRGVKGTPVTITIFHEGDKQSKDIKIIRDTINLPTLDTEVRKDGIFVIKLYSFSANSATLFRNAIKQFVASKSDKIILDLRGNPGGYLSSAVDISSWFLPGGKTVVTEDYGEKMKPEIFRSAGYTSVNDKVKIVVLIDGGSASASEIVSGALQDQKRAKLVGVKSFGKGSVQEVIKVTSDTLLKITVAKWLTPNGNTIAEKGLTPDYVVPMTAADKTAGKDPQMDKAVELLLSGKI